MLEKYLLENVVGKNLIKSGEVLVAKEYDTLSITSGKGNLAIKLCEGEVWKVGYFDIFEENWVEVFNGENKIMEEWYQQFLQNQRDEDNYVQLPSFEKVLPLGEALELSLYILSKILPRENSQNTNSN